MKITDREFNNFSFTVFVTGLIKNKKAAVENTTYSI